MNLAHFGWGKIRGFRSHFCSTSATPGMETKQEKRYKIYDDSTHITQTGLPPARKITQPASHLSHPISIIRHPPTSTLLGPATPAARFPAQPHLHLN